MPLIISIPLGHTSLVLDDSEERIAYFQDVLPDIVVCHNVTEVITALACRPVPFNVMFLDHDLGVLDANGNPGECGDGTQCAMKLAAHGLDGRNVVIHSWNTAGAERMKKLLPGALVAKFGSFKIVRAV